MLLPLTIQIPMIIYRNIQAKRITDLIRVDKNLKKINKYKIQFLLSRPKKTGHFFS